MYVPESLRICVPEKRHDAPMAGHGGQKKMNENLVSGDHVWPGLGRFVRDYVTGCQMD